MTRSDRISMWIAWHLPRELVGWCLARVFANATTGIYSGQEATTLTLVEAGKRWWKA